MGSDVTRLLLDTHTLLWWWAGTDLLSQPAQAAISDLKASVHVSAASAWEIATKVRLGRLAPHVSVISGFHDLVTGDRFVHLPVTHRHGLRAGGYQCAHRDPFDRMRAAQAELESLVLVTRDIAFGQFPVRVLW